MSGQTRLSSKKASWFYYRDPAQDRGWRTDRAFRLGPYIWGHDLHFEWTSPTACILRAVVGS